MNYFYNEHFVAYVDSIAGHVADFEEISATIFLRAREPDAVIRRAITGLQAICSHPWYKALAAFFWERKETETFLSLRVEK